MAITIIEVVMELDSMVSYLLLELILENFDVSLNIFSLIHVAFFCRYCFIVVVVIVVVVVVDVVVVISFYLGRPWVHLRSFSMSMARWLVKL